jgi:hypothetical protein
LGDVFGWIVHFLTKCDGTIPRLDDVLDEYKSKG